MVYGLMARKAKFQPSSFIFSERAFFFSERLACGIFFVYFCDEQQIMESIRKKEIAIHVILTAVLLALFGIWYGDTLSKAPHRLQEKGFPSYVEEGHRPPGPGPGIGNPGDREKGPVPMRPENMILILGLFLTVGANLAVHSYFRSIRDRQRMQALENENLSRQLETLRYQINPHFFMNTLNNIHALVDLDPGKAKESIEEFSKLMRIVLYEGNSPKIPLQKEIEYLKHFISLMRLRYPEDVNISTSFPESSDGTEVPPLMMASFVENAFKHGISYEHDSFVRISISVDGGKIIFRCANSRVPGSADVQHGLGLENTRKRLDLLYAGNYTLHIDEGEDVYDILLIIPA